MNNDDHPLSDQVRHDLVLLASGEADEDTARRASLLVKHDRRAALYLSEIRSVIQHLEGGLSERFGGAPQESLTDREIAAIAARIRMRSHWRPSLRFWAIAAAVALMLLPAFGLIRHLATRRLVATAHLYSTGSALTLPGKSSTVDVLPGQPFKTNGDVGIMEAPAGSKLILGPDCVLRIMDGSIMLDYGSLYVRTSDLLVRMPRIDVRVTGEAVLSTSPEGVLIQAFAGQVAVGPEPASIVYAGQDAHAIPFRLSKVPYPKPAWLLQGLQLLKEQK